MSDVKATSPGGGALLARFVREKLRFLSIPTSPDEELALDDALLAAGHDLAEAIRWQDPRSGLYDVELGAGPIEAIASRALGRQPARILDVEGLIPFDWSSFDGLAALESVMPRLPGYLSTTSGPFTYLSKDLAHPPALWASHEAPGLHVRGLVAESAWRAWITDLEQATAAWPLRMP
jgi:hypothetical protein